MAINLKPLGDASERWSRRSGQASEDYLRGVETPKRPWAESTIAAEANYKQSIIQAANEGRQGKGVKKAGNERWAGQIAKKGRNNYLTGVAAATDDYAQKMGPYMEAISKITLPPRGAKNSPDNYRRVQIVGETLAKLKQSMLGGSR